MENREFFTLPLEDSEGTITYIINEIQDMPDRTVRALLFHPLAPKVLVPFLAKSREDLLAAQTQTQGKSNLQKTLEYANKKKDLLEFLLRTDVESLCMSFVVYRLLTPRQKKRLSGFVGIVSSIYFHSDLRLAVRFVEENYALLDDFNKAWFDSFMKVTKQTGFFSGLPKQLSPKQRPVMFNIAGFVLSQLEP
jgi:hypothetical protein